MNIFNRTGVSLWNIDPGYFRLKQAFKTILAILITLWLVRTETIITKVIASISCGMSMQGIVSKSLLWRFIQVLAFDLCCFFAFILGLLIRDSSEFRTIALMSLGFAVNYFRRFGLHKSMAPMMIWVLCFIATILPFDLHAKSWNDLYGLLVGLSVSALTTLIVFPENYPILFVKNSNRIFKALSSGLLDIRRYLAADISSDFETTVFVRAKEGMYFLLESNQAIEQSTLFEQQKLIAEIIMQQYALFQAYTMIVEAYRAFQTHHYELPRSFLVALNRVNKQFALLFNSTTMHKNYAVTAQPITIALGKLTETLNQARLSDPGLIMILLNLKLGFTLLHQHFTYLLGNNDAS